MTQLPTETKTHLHTQGGCARPGGNWAYVRGTGRCGRRIVCVVSIGDGCVHAYASVGRMFGLKKKKMPPIPHADDALLHTLSLKCTRLPRCILLRLTKRPKKTEPQGAGGGQRGRLVPWRAPALWAQGEFIYMLVGEWSSCACACSLSRRHTTTQTAL